MEHVIISTLRYSKSAHLPKANYSAEKISVSVIFFIMAAIVGITVSGIYTKNFNKRILDILFNLSYMIAPAFINMLFLMINTCSGHISGTEMYGNYIYNYDYLLSPLLVLVYAFAGLVCFLPLVKKWHAQEE